MHSYNAADRANNETISGKGHIGGNPRATEGLVATTNSQHPDGDAIVKVRHWQVYHDWYLILGREEALVTENLAHFGALRALL